MKHNTLISKLDTSYIFWLVIFLTVLFCYSCNQSDSNKEKANSDIDNSESNPSLLTGNINAPIAEEIVSNLKSRVRDAYGSGQYGASRDAGVRKHNGIDIIVAPGEKIFSPIKGNIVRQAMPYRDDPNYKGIILKGIQEWDGYEIKIFYIEGLFSGQSFATQEIGYAQNLSLKYPGITNHIHVEVKYLGIQIDPFTIWQYSF